jgi:hypothetical protein
MMDVLQTPVPVPELEIVVHRALRRQIKNFPDRLLGPAIHHAKVDFTAAKLEPSNQPRKRVQKRQRYRKVRTVPWAASWAIDTAGTLRQTAYDAIEFS